MFLGMRFLIFRYIYPHGNHFLQVTLFTSDCVTLGSYQESCSKYHAHFLIFSYMLLVVTMILDIHASYLGEIILFLVLGQLVPNLW